jgi:hypothetical protein
LYGAETWTFRKVDRKHLESFEVQYCRRMEQIVWTDSLKKEEVLQKVKKERNILHTTK